MRLLVFPATGAREQWLLRLFTLYSWPQIARVRLKGDHRWNGRLETLKNINKKYKKEHKKEVMGRFFLSRLCHDFFFFFLFTSLRNINIYCFDVELLTAQPCCFTLSQGRADKRWLVTFSKQCRIPHKHVSTLHRRLWRDQWLVQLSLDQSHYHRLSPAQTGHQSLFQSSHSSHVHRLPLDSCENLIY